MDWIEEIKERVEKATPGPLDVAILDLDKDATELIREILSHGEGETWLVWCPEHPDTIGEHPRPEHAVIFAITGNGPTKEANAEFIAHAREDVPRLIAEVERLRGLVAQAEWLGADSVGNYGTSCQYCGVIRVVRDTGRLRDHAPSCPAFSAPGVVR